MFSLFNNLFILLRIDHINTEEKNTRWGFVKGDRVHVANTTLRSSQLQWKKAIFEGFHNCPPKPGRLISI